MTIAVMSDLHDNVAAWEIINRMLRERKITTLINCGDTCAPAMLHHMTETFPGTIHTVFGNVADKELEAEKVKEWPRVVHYGQAGELTIENRRIFFNHYPAVARDKAVSGNFDLCCYGHDHSKHAERIDQALLLNPGTAGGMFHYPTFAVIDLRTMSYEFMNVTL